MATKLIITRLETRLTQLEKISGRLPCTKPGHDQFFLFVQHGMADPGTETLLESIAQCENSSCRNSLVMRVVHPDSSAASQLGDKRTC